MHSRTRYAGHKDTVKKKAYTKINWTLNVTERWTLQNNSISNEFNKFYRVWHEKVKILTWKSKNLTFHVFYLKKNPEKTRFFKMGLDSPGI